MPLARGYSKYRPEKPPNQIGVYELAYGGNIVYIGSGNIYDRLQDHNRNNISFRKYRCKVTNSTDRARQIERREQRNYRDQNGRLPKYNKQIG